MSARLQNDQWPHKPVLLREWLRFLDSLKIYSYLDATVGAGGHAEQVLTEHSEIKKFIAFDQDKVALSYAKKRLEKWEAKTSFVEKNFLELSSTLQEMKSSPLDAILFDLGVSSMHLDTPERGFSLRNDGPLDMRMDQRRELTAEIIVNEWPEEKLAQIIRDFGEEKKWRAAAKVILEARKSTRIVTTLQLVDVLSSVLKKKHPGSTVHPATLVFQALRIAVNGELEILQSALDSAVSYLSPGGILGVITFHSLEDRIVKQLFQYLASDKESSEGIRGVFLDKDPTVKLLTRKPVIALEDELRDNPRARSAKLRVVEKL